MDDDMISTSIDRVLFGDCLDVMQQIPDTSIDAIITDPPYGITEARWDVQVDWPRWWREVRRIRKLAAPTVIFCSGRFCGDLWASNPKEWRYDWIWKKKPGCQFFCANRRPLPAHEKIFVFCDLMPKYNPQKTYLRGVRHKRHNVTSTLYNNPPYDGYAADGMRYPTDVVYFSKPQSESHPTAKPVDLCEYLIRTYTDVGDVVLDPFAGGGAVPVAAVRTCRHFIGIEKDPEWHAFAETRVKNEQNQTRIEWW